MPDRTLNWGDPADAATRYRTRDDDPAGGGNFVVVEDLDGNLIPLQYNPTSGALETAVPIDTGSNNITTTGTVSTGTLEADVLLADNVVLNKDSNIEVERANKLTVDGSTTATIFDSADPVNVIYGNVVGDLAGDVVYTWDDGTETRLSENGRGETNSGDGFDVAMIPPAKDVKKLTFNNLSAGSREFGYYVIHE